MSRIVFYDTENNERTSVPYTDNLAMYCNKMCQVGLFTPIEGMGYLFAFSKFENYLKQPEAILL